MRSPILDIGGNLDRRDYSIIRGAENNDLDEVQKALAADYSAIGDIDEVSGATALHIAAADGNLPMVRYLIEQRGCRLSAEDKAGRNPAFLAFVIGREDIVDIICKKMADELSQDFSDLRRRRVNPGSGEVVDFSKPPKPNSP